jgi:hypothetical protein
LLHVSDMAEVQTVPDTDQMPIKQIPITRFVLPSDTPSYTIDEPAKHL